MSGIDTERWKRLVPYLARALAKPAWSIEEREPKLVVARRAREALEPGGGADLRSRLARLEPAAKKRYALLRPEDLEWLERWAAADPGSLAAALAVFSQDGADGEMRFAAWADACARAAEAGHAARDEDAALATGALFNFATDPAGLPLISHGAPALDNDEPLPRGEALFERLEALLGHEREPHSALADRYAGHLRFAQVLRDRLLDEGVAVTDMIDVQSLVFIAALEEDLWASDPPRAADGPPPDAYLAICAIYRDEAPYLPEWIEFHRIVGVERFFLYDNRSRDSHREVLAPYVQDGTVVVHDWPGPPAQMDVYNECLAAHGGGARWIAFIDVDEFLFSPELRPLPEVLRDYERYPGVGVNWAMFGTSGHRTRPAGLVIDNYLRRARKDRGFVNRPVKVVAQPRATTRCLTAHRFEFRHGLAVDEHGFPIHRGTTKSVSFERLRINHYYTRSEAELRRKVERRERLERSGTPGWPTRPRDLERALDELDDEHDELITAYSPQVRAALEARASGVPRDVAQPSTAGN